MLNKFSRMVVMASLFSTWLTSELNAQEVNKLSEAEVLAQYDLLFNGVDLNNWHAYRLPAVTDAWAVKSTAPLGARIENQSGTKLPILTNKKYMNFDLKVDVQVTVTGNSGIFTRYQEVATQPGNTRSGPEFQICGSANDDCIEPTKKFGACYDMFGAKPALIDSWYNPNGAWNQIRIVVYDSSYVHYGNGKKLLEYKIGSSEFIQAYNKSKYFNDGNNGNYYNIHPGGILLQHHGETGMTFRNLKAKELNVHPFKREFPDGKWPDILSQDFVFGTPQTGISSAKPLQDLKLSIQAGPSNTTQITIPVKHTRFTAVGINGRPVAFQKFGEGVYSFPNSENTLNLVIASVQVGRATLTKVIHLQ